MLRTTKRDTPDDVSRALTHALRTCVLIDPKPMLVIYRYIGHPIDDRTHSHMVKGAILMGTYQCES